MTKSPRTRHERFLDGIRVFNKHILNHFTLALAGSGRGPFSIVHHIGRRSGRHYRTPVLASYTNGTVIIPLSYGEKVDWLRNVLARGGCEIVRRKQRLQATDPQVIEAAAALALLPENRRRLFERFELEKFLRMLVAR